MNPILGMCLPLDQSNGNSKEKETACFLKHLGSLKPEVSPDFSDYLHIIATDQFSDQTEYHSESGMGKNPLS